MVKKESAKRGYMTKEEVEGHLKGIGTTSAKITYLNDILKKRRIYGIGKRIGLISKNTEEAIFDLLGDLYSKKKEYDRAAASYRAAKNYPKYDESSEEVGEFMIKHPPAAKLFGPTRVAGFFLWMAHDFEKLGEMDRARKYHKKAIKIMKDYEGDFYSASPTFKTFSRENFFPDFIGPESTEGIIKKLEAQLGRFDKKEGELEKRTSAVISIVGVLAGLFFLSPVVTGNAIGAISSNNSTGIGVALIVLGLIGVYFWKQVK